MSLYYKISDFCIMQNQSIPPVIADAILDYHVVPLSKVQEETPFDVYPSYDTPNQPSGYRPWIWEKARGRNGGSQHTFGEREKMILPNQKGACDITCENFKENKDTLLKALIEHTDYIRFAVYDTFIHIDYKDTHQGKRLLFSSNRKSEWKFIKFV